MHCDHCPLKSSGQPCPDPAYYCPRVARDRSLPEKARFWAGAVLRAADVEPPPEQAQPDRPGLLTMATNFVGAVVEHVADGGRKASPEVQGARKAACESCPIYDLAASRCLKCGCLAMDLKRSWASSSCPDEPPRWDSV